MCHLPILSMKHTLHLQFILANDYSPLVVVIHVISYDSIFAIVHLYFELYFHTVFLGNHQCDVPQFYFI